MDCSSPGSVTGAKLRRALCRRGDEIAGAAPPVHFFHGRHFEMNRLELLYAEIAEIGRKHCAQCSPPFHCCSRTSCNHSRWWARTAWDVELQKQQDGELPFLAPSGCSVAPHLRPVCSVFVCDASRMPPKYHQLLNEIAK